MQTYQKEIHEIIDICQLTCSNRLNGTTKGGCKHRDGVQADILDGGPDNRQATALSDEDIYLIGALMHEAPQAFNGIGGLNVPVPGGRKA